MQLFLAWCDVLDFCVSIPLLQAASPERLATLVETALGLVKDCGWGDRMRPKMHWPLHWPNALERWQCLPLGGLGGIAVT